MLVRPHVEIFKKMENLSSPFRSENPESTKDAMLHSSNSSGVALQLVFGFIAFFSFFGNLVFCVVLLRKRCLLKKPYNILLLVLAITDMFTGNKLNTNTLHFQSIYKKISNLLSYHVLNFVQFVMNC